VIVEAAALQRAHDIAASTGSPMIRWHTGPHGMDLRGVGPSFSAEAIVPVLDGDESFGFAAPATLAGAWLKGVTGQIHVVFDPDQRLVALAAERSAIELAVATYGPDMLPADNLSLDTEDLTVLGVSSELWAAIEAVSWATAARSKAVNEAQWKAVHVSHGKVWATDKSNGAWIDMAIPEEACPMIPQGLGAIGKHVDMDSAVVAIDSKNRLRVIDSDCDLVAPLIAGEPLGDLMSNEQIIRTREQGYEYVVSSKELTDALARLDRVDIDELANNAGLGGRVKLDFSGGQLNLEVLVHKRRAIESIDADFGPDTFWLMPIRRLREVVDFLDAEELVIRFFSKKAPIVIDAEDRHVFLMPVTGDL